MDSGHDPPRPAGGDAVTTPKPLTIGLHPSLVQAEWVKDLQEKGHQVFSWEPAQGDQGIFDCDLILGPNCCRFVPGMERFLDSLIKGARAIKYKGTKGDKGRV